MSVDALLHEKRDAVLAIAKKHGAARVRVFGSAARGTSGPGSDVDLLLEMEAGRTLLDIIAIKQDVEDLIGRRVDVCTESSLSPYFRQEVLSEALPL